MGVGDELRSCQRVRSSGRMPSRASDGEYQPRVASSFSTRVHHVRIEEGVARSVTMTTVSYQWQRIRRPTNVQAVRPPTMSNARDGVDPRAKIYRVREQWSFLQ